MYLSVSLRQLEYFVAAAEAGTMSGAAERFPVSSSAVSLAVAQLERSLGVQLFHRVKAKGLSLTAAGAELLPDARRLLAEAGELEHNARSLGHELKGRLTIGCYPTLTPFLMPRVLDDFPRLHPLVEMRFLEGSVAELQDWLIEGRCEAALMFDIGIRPALERTVLFAIRPQVVLPASHRLAERSAVRLRELADEPMVMIDMPPSEQFFTGLLERADVTPTIVHRTISFEAVRSLVARGLGWSMLIQRPAVDLSYEGLPLVTVPIRDRIDDVEILLVTPPGRQTRRAVAFGRRCVELFAKAERRRR